MKTSYLYFIAFQAETPTGVITADRCLTCSFPIDSTTSLEAVRSDLMKSLGASKVSIRNFKLLNSW